MAAPLAAHYNAVYMHAGLFARIDALHARRDALGLTPSSGACSSASHLDFVRAGARLAPDAQARYAQVMERLAELTTRFAQNVLPDEAAFQLRAAAARPTWPACPTSCAPRRARRRPSAAWPTRHVITLSRSLIVPFLTFSRAARPARAGLARLGRRAASTRASTTTGRWRARSSRCATSRRALHGHASYADYALADTMAGTRDAVHQLLDEVWPRALAALEARARGAAAGDGDAGVQARRRRSRPGTGATGPRRCASTRYALDDAEVKPYFPLERMVEAAFDCAQRLFGLQLRARAPTCRSTTPTSRPTRCAMRDGALVGVFLHDNFARADQAQRRLDELASAGRAATSPAAARRLPIIVNNNNFAKGAPGEPTLLSLRRRAHAVPRIRPRPARPAVATSTYERLSGTQVLRDFVELPSQLFEHWLDRARGAEAPRAPLAHRRADPRRADRAPARGAPLQPGLRDGALLPPARCVDMAVHALPRAQTAGTTSAPSSARSCARMGLPHGVGMNHRLVHFQHLFAGSGYAAGYYVYLWAEVLDADGFDAFVEAGDPFDPRVAARLRRFIYASGNSARAGGGLPRRSAAATPQVEPMLRKRGLLETVA